MKKFSLCLMVLFFSFSILSGLTFAGDNPPGKNKDGAGIYFHTVTGKTKFFKSHPGNPSQWIFVGNEEPEPPCGDCKDVVSARVMVSSYAQDGPSFAGSEGNGFAAAVGNGTLKATANGYTNSYANTWASMPFQPDAYSYGTANTSVMVNSLTTKKYNMCFFSWELPYPGFHFATVKGEATQGNGNTAYDSFADYLTNPYNESFITGGNTSTGKFYGMSFGMFGNFLAGGANADGSTFLSANAYPWGASHSGITSGFSSSYTTGFGVAKSLGEGEIYGFSAMNEGMNGQYWGGVAEGSAKYQYCNKTVGYSPYSSGSGMATVSGVVGGGPTFDGGVSSYAQESATAITNGGTFDAK